MIIIDKTACTKFLHKNQILFSVLEVKGTQVKHEACNAIRVM